MLRLAGSLDDGYLAEVGLTAAHRDVLGAIARLGPAASPSAVAEAVGMRRSNVSAALASLRAGDLVAPDAPAPDGRRRLVALTASGRSALAALDEHRCHRLSALAGTRLAAEEVRRLVAVTPLLERLAAPDPVAPRRRPA